MVAADGDRLFLVMELVAGRDLAAVVREQGALPPPRVAGLGAQAAHALAAAHAAGLVHGDVKPDNLLLAGDGLLKLTDFGIARPLPGPGTGVGTGTGADGRAERPGAVVGTSGFTAPERFLGHPPTPAGDLYALGCVLYELLTGQPPFTAEDPAAMRDLHLNEVPVPPGRLIPTIPPELEQAVLRLLVKDPAARPSDAGHVAEVLDAIGRTLPDPWPADRPASSTQVLPSLAPGARRARSGEAGRAGPGSASSSTGPRAFARPAGKPLLAAAVGTLVLITAVVAIVSTAGSGSGGTPGPRAGTPTGQAPPALPSPKPIRPASRTSSPSGRPTTTAPTTPAAGPSGTDRRTRKDRDDRGNGRGNGRRGSDDD